MNTLLEISGKKPAFAPVRILVAEDDHVVRRFNAIALSDSGYQVDLAEDGAAAWDAIQTNHYDLVITDNKMPRLSGVELIERLHSMKVDVPIILASGIAPAELKNSLQPVTVLQKPFAMDELLNTVESVLRPAQKSTEPEIFLVKRYTPDQKQEWDSFMTGAKNATFLFYRDYMDYHRDRFTDYSLMIYNGNKLAGLLPANLSADGSLISHEGLTYGGLVVSRDATLKNVLACFYAILSYLNQEEISKCFYKKIPAFYNTLPDDDVAYALFLLEAKLYRRDCGTTVSEEDRLPFRRTRKNLIKKATDLGVCVVQEKTLQPFWEHVLVPQLAVRHGAKPVHTLEEITLLTSRFPEHIKQFSAYHQDKIVAGATIYETPTVAHAQYAAVTDEGREMGAQAYLFGWLIEDYKDKRFFDFGTCNEKEGRALNHGLLDWKEGFGARCFTHDFYEISTANYTRLESLLQGQQEIILPPEKTSYASTNGHCINFIHPKAIVDEGALIGKGTRVWAFAHIVSGATVGDDCNICDHTFIESGVHMGNRVTVKCGVFLWNGLTIEDGVFIGPNAVFTNDYRPRSKKYLQQPDQTLLKEGCTLGAHSTTLPGITVGRWAMVGAGSVVTHDVPDFGLVVGSPARLRGWICRCGEKLSYASSRLLACRCGRFYEQISENEVKETNNTSSVIYGLDFHGVR
jgi:acetyltransferase-like isoleucine patch superfamily enzyme/CheY-like chemotaxis protein